MIYVVTDGGRYYIYCVFIDEKNVDFFCCCCKETNYINVKCIHGIRYVVYRFVAIDYLSYVKRVRVWFISNWKTNACLYRPIGFEMNAVRSDCNNDNVCTKRQRFPYPNGPGGLRFPPFSMVSCKTARDVRNCIRNAYVRTTRALTRRTDTDGVSSRTSDMPVCNVRLNLIVYFNVIFKFQYRSLVFSFSFLYPCVNIYECIRLGYAQMPCAVKYFLDQILKYSIILVRYGNTLRSNKTSKIQ